MTRQHKIWLGVLAALMLGLGLSIKQQPEDGATTPSVTEASDAAADVTAQPRAIADRPVTVDTSSGPSAGKDQSPKAGAPSERTKRFMPVAYSDGMYWQHVLDCGLTSSVHQRFEITIKDETSQGCSMTAIGVMVICAPCCVIGPSAAKARGNQRMGGGYTSIESANDRSLLGQGSDTRRQFPNPILLVQTAATIKKNLDRAGRSTNLHNGTGNVGRYRYEGTHTGHFLGYPATGNAFAMRSIDIWRVEDGRFAEHWDELNTLDIFIQVGAVPPPGQPL